MYSLLSRRVALSLMLKTLARRRMSQLQNSQVTDIFTIHNIIYNNAAIVLYIQTAAETGAPKAPLRLILVR
jgi:hypothetical protein